MKITWLCFTLSFAAWMPSALCAAQITIKSATSAPTANLFVASNSTTSGSISAYYRGQVSAGNPTRRSVGDAFQAPSTAEIAAITWKISAFHSDVLSKSFSIRLYEVGSLAGTGTKGDPSHAESMLLRTWTGTLSPALSLSTPYITFGLEGDPLTLDAGKYYLFVFGFTEPTSATTAANQLSFVTSGNDGGSVLTPSPRHWRETDGTWTSFNRNHMEFYVQTIPETSTSLLIGSGLFSLLLFQRRFRA